MRIWRTCEVSKQGKLSDLSANLISGKKSRPIGYAVVEAHHLASAIKTWHQLGTKTRCLRGFFLGLVTGKAHGVGLITQRSVVQIDPTSVAGEATEESGKNWKKAFK